MAIRGCLVVALAGCHFSADQVPDAADAAPISANIVFITSGPVVPGNLGGLGGADLVCQNHAMSAHLPGHYIAWLSTHTDDARARLTNAGARGWVRVDGK